MEPRDYQKQAILSTLSAWRGYHKHVVGRAATGAGKTRTIMWLTEAVAHQRRTIPKVLFVVDNNDLLEQTNAVAQQHSVGHATIFGGDTKDFSGDFVTATVQSLAIAIDDVPKFDIVYYDECHVSLAEMYTEVIKSIRRKFSPLELAVTATPFRDDEIGLRTLFDKVSFDIPFWYLVDNGYLARPIATGFRTWNDIFSYSNHMEKLLWAWSNYSNHGQTIAYTPDTKTAENLANFFSKNGVPSAYVSGYMTPKKRLEIKNGLSSGKLRVVFNASLWTKGIDIPIVSNIMMIRRAGSKIIYEQCVGRGARIHSGKTSFNVLDFYPEETRSLGESGDILGSIKTIGSVPQLRGKAARMRIMDRIEKRNAGVLASFDISRIDLRSRTS